ncbi:MAG: TfoX/Sxy family protein [Azonexus sp.]|jgi:DNA transformation protein|nr:TfoX/Sxy family protein [Azonexus sp.]
MSQTIENLPNLGRYTAACLAEIGVSNADELRAMGAVEAYARLRFQFGRNITLNALWGMDAALSGIHWRHITEDRKRKLKMMLAQRTGQ